MSLLRLSEKVVTGLAAVAELAEGRGELLGRGDGLHVDRRLVREERVAQDVAMFALPLVAGSSIAAGWVTARPESDAEKPLPPISVSDEDTGVAVLLRKDGKPKDFLMVALSDNRERKLKQLTQRIDEIARLNSSEESRNDYQ